MYATLNVLVALVCFPGVLLAQNAPNHCKAPKLDGGYFHPVNEEYAHQFRLTYACEKGLKPAAKTWWAISTCQNGAWTPKPQCINETSCIQPEVANGKYTESPDGWFTDGQKIRVTCDIGYVTKNHDATAVCTNGTWLSVPVCEKSPLACSPPAMIPHAVILHRRLKVFPADYELKYECEEGYSVEGDVDKTISCISGTWTTGPACRPSSSQGSKDEPMIMPGPSSSQGSKDEPMIMPVEHCGAHPAVENGYITNTLRRSLIFACRPGYKIDSPNIVCYGNGVGWSDGVCKATFCEVHPGQHAQLRLHTIERVYSGEKRTLNCIWDRYYMEVECSDGQLSIGRCSRF